MTTTKRLHLLRHAKSSRDDPELHDHDRPLAPRGRRAAARIRAYLRENEIAPDLVLCSSATRARQTLDGIASALPDDVDVRVEPELYRASEHDLLARLQRVSEDVESVIVIGHNPAIERLVLELAHRGPALGRVRQKFPTAALASLAVPTGWSALRPGEAELVEFVAPRELE